MTYCPSRPAIGDVLTPKIIDTVGSSMAIGGIAIRCSTSAIVSPIVMSSMPARQTMSPAAASWMSTRFRPSNANSLVTFVCCTAASSLHDGHRIADLHAAVEDAADRDAARGSRSNRGWRPAAAAARRDCRAAAARARRSRRTAAAGPRPRRPASRLAVPGPARWCRAPGKSSCSSVASRSMNRS